MKYIVIILLIPIALVLAACSGDKCGYKTWKIEDGWSFSHGQINELVRISFEYPDCFHKLSKTEYEKKMRMFDSHWNPGALGELSMHTTDLYRHIMGNDALFTSGAFDYTHSLNITLFFPVRMTDIITGWDENNTGHESFPEYFIKYFYGRSSSEIVDEKQITVSGFTAYSLKYNKENNLFGEQYQNRVIIAISFEFNDILVLLEMNAWEGEAEEVEEYYNHLIETFTISE